MLKPTDYGLKLKQTAKPLKPVSSPLQFNINQFGGIPKVGAKPSYAQTNQPSNPAAWSGNFQNGIPKNLAISPQLAQNYSQNYLGGKVYDSSLLNPPNINGGKIAYNPQSGMFGTSTDNLLQQRGGSQGYGSQFTPFMPNAGLVNREPLKVMSFADAQAAQQGRPTSQTFNGGGYSSDYSGGSTSSLANVFGDGSGGAGMGGSGNDQQSYLNNLFAQNGIDGFNLDGKSNEQLSSILTAIQGQINKPQDQGSLVDLLRKSREEAGVGGLQNTLKTIQDQINQRNQSYQLGSNKISDQPIPQDLLIGQRQALQRQQEAELSGLNDQQRLAQEQLGFGNDYANQLYGAYQGDQEYAQNQPNRLIDLASKAFGLQQMQGDLANMPLERQLKQVQLQQAIKEGKAAGYKFEQVGNTLLRIGPNGDVTPVYTEQDSGSGSDIKLTQDNYKNAGYANRASTSTNIIDQLGAQFTGASGFLQGLGLTPNFLKSSQYQQFEQAGRDFINAVLRKESGAAISDSEFNNAKKQYIPQPGDSAAVLQQKSQNRQSVIQNLIQSSSSAYSGGGSGGTWGW